jgi:hypothetical protein
MPIDTRMKDPVIITGDQLLEEFRPRELSDLKKALLPADARSDYCIGAIDHAGHCYTFPPGEELTAAEALRILPEVNFRYLFQGVSAEQWGVFVSVSAQSGRVRDPDAVAKYFTKDS